MLPGREAFTMITLILRLTTILVLWLVGPVTPARAEAVNHQLLAEQLLGADDSKRWQALEATTAILVDLHEALIIAIEREARYRTERHAASMRGEKWEGPTGAEYLARLTEVVIKLRDPRTIPSLVAVLGTGSSATPFALAAFGEPAVPELVKVVKASDNIFLVDQAMVALRCLVEHTSTQPLSSNAVDAITNVAELRLENPIRLASTGVILGQAVDLAIALDDARLRRIVELIASDPEAVRSRGVTDSKRINRIQKNTQDRLSGTEPRQICAKL